MSEALPAYVQKSVKLGLTYREKLVLIWLAAKGDWASTKEIKSIVCSSHSPDTSGGDHLRDMYERGLVERTGTKNAGYKYRVVL